MSCEQRLSVLPLSLIAFASEELEWMGLVAKTPLFSIFWGFETGKSLLRHSPDSQSSWVGGALIMGLLREKEDSASACSKKTYFTASSRARPRVITCSRSMLYRKAQHPRLNQPSLKIDTIIWIIRDCFVCCIYLESFRGSILPSESSLLVIGPSIVRFWLGFSASRECAWTKARPRDWECKKKSHGSLSKVFQLCFACMWICFECFGRLTMIIFTLWVTGLGLLSSSSASTWAKWPSCQIGRPSRLSLESCTCRHAWGHTGIICTSYSGQ